MIWFLLENRFYLYYGALVAVTVMAFWKGAGPEKIMVGLFWGTIVLPHQIYHAFAGRYVHLDIFDLTHFAFDAALCVGAIAAALYANRIYPLWFAGFQIIAVQSHLARATTDNIAPLAVGIMQIGPSYLQIITLAIGLWAHIRRERSYGPYRSWRVPSWRQGPPGQTA